MKTKDYLWKQNIKLEIVSQILMTILKWSLTKNLTHVKNSSEFLLAFINELWKKKLENQNFEKW